MLRPSIAWLAVALCLGGLVLAVRAGDGAASKPAATPDQRIAELEARVAELEARLKELELRGSLRAYTAIMPPGTTMPPADPIPPDWGRRWFNGREYYIIPLASQDQSAP